MKKFIIPFITLISLYSCSKDNLVSQQELPLVITKADFLTNYKVDGATFTFFEAPITTVSIPVAGDNQNWDFSTLAETSSYTDGGVKFLTPTNSAFPSATYSISGANQWNISGVMSPPYSVNLFYELNDAGVYELSFSQNESTSIDIPSLGATINFPQQNLNYTGTTKYPFVLFPAKSGNAAITTTGIKRVSNFTATAAAFGLNNTPGQTIATTSVTQEVIASGAAKLKGIGNKRVLVLKYTHSETTNYFLAGAPAPAQLLSNLGVTDGAVVTGTTYRIIGEGLGTVGVIEVNQAGVITNASFRKA